MSVIVFLGAVGRSGTTLLERVGATSPSFVSLGEMVHFWERGVIANEPCGCGVPLRSCPEWTAIVTQAFGGWDQLDIDGIVASQRGCDRNRYIPFLVAPRLAPRRIRESLADFTATLERLYTAISDHFGDAVLIDASKHPSYLYVLRRLHGHDLRLLHVVRDPRGVANSWNKVVARPEDGEEMERLGPWRAAARWTSHNLLFHVAARLGVPRVPLRYERFAAEPETFGKVLAATVPERAIVAPVFDGASINLIVNHTVSGNPMRFDTGAVQIRPDDNWRTAMPTLARRIVGALTFPLRVWYRA